MESNWTRADFRTHPKRQGAFADLLRTTHEVLAKELGLSLSAFLRVSVSSSFTESVEHSFGELQREDPNSSFAGVVIRPGDHKLLVELEYSILFPLICIALGAKEASLAPPQRKPTDIELQVARILFRLVLAETYRAWVPLVKMQLETVSVEIDQFPFRTFPLTDPVHVIRFELTVAGQTGRLCLIAPQQIFAAMAAADEPVVREQPESPPDIDNTLQLMMPARVSLDVWLDGSQMQLSDLLRLREGQIVKLDHPVERRAVCTLNGKPGFSGQIVSTGAHRAFLVEESSSRG